MEGEQVTETLSMAESTILDLLTFHYVEGFKFSFPIGGRPLLTNVKGEPLVACFGITKINDDFARLNTPENVSGRKQQNLGALFYLLTGIALEKDKRTLYSDNYSQPGSLSYQGKGLWKQLIFLGLAENLEDIRHYQLILPKLEIIEELHEQASANALAIYATGEIQKKIKTIQDRLRLPAAGEILGKPEGQTLRHSPSR